MKPVLQPIPVDRLIPYATNSRTHSDEQVAQIAASIREFGFTNPVLVDENNDICPGFCIILYLSTTGMGGVWQCWQILHGAICWKY